MCLLLMALLGYFFNNPEAIATAVCFAAIVALWPILIRIEMWIKKKNLPHAPPASRPPPPPSSYFTFTN